jgi:hypothetical protein
MTLRAASFGVSVVLVASLLLPADLRAEVSVSGTKNAVIVDAKGASLDEVVAVLNSAIDAKISFTPTVNPAINGRYSGTLRRVLSRMLDGQNFILNSSGEQTTIILAANSGANTGRRPSSNSDGVQPRPNSTTGSVASSEDIASTPIVQGWSGGFSLPRAVK